MAVTSSHQDHASFDRSRKTQSVDLALGNLDRHCTSLGPEYIEKQVFMAVQGSWVGFDWVSIGFGVL